MVAKHLLHCKQIRKSQCRERHGNSGLKTQWRHSCSFTFVSPLLRKQRGDWLMAGAGGVVTRVNFSEQLIGAGGEAIVCSTRSC